MLWIKQHHFSPSASLSVSQEWLAQIPVSWSGPRRMRSSPPRARVCGPAARLTKQPACWHCGSCPGSLIGWSPAGSFLKAVTPKEQAGCGDNYLCTDTPRGGRAARMAPSSSTMEAREVWALKVKAVTALTKCQGTPREHFFQQGTAGNNFFSFSPCAPQR